MKLKVYWEKEIGLIRKKIIKGNGVLINVSSRNYVSPETAFIISNGKVVGVETENIIKIEQIDEENDEKEKQNEKTK
jgi:hypothetical protein